MRLGKSGLFAVQETTAGKMSAVVLPREAW
nr:MAG TPA: hypothetical protein [Caudoviricetes sp.]